MVWLQGCTVAPTPQEKAARLASTLNVYEDNRVAYQARAGYQSYWGWSVDKQAVLALEMRGQAYNARDIARVTVVEVRPSRSTTYRVTLVLKSGQSITDDVDFNGNNVAWLACDAQKACTQRSPFGSSDYRRDLGRMLTGIHDADLMRSEPSRDPASELMKDYRAIPSAGGGLREAVFLDEPGKAELAAKLDRLDERWKQVLQRREQQQAADRAARQAREEAIQKEAAQMRAHVRIGTQTNCGAVFEVRLPMVGVQTMNGMQFLPLSQLYGPSASCRFVNGQYVGR